MTHVLYVHGDGFVTGAKVNMQRIEVLLLSLVLGTAGSVKVPVSVILSFCPTWLAFWRIWANLIFHRCAFVLVDVQLSHFLDHLEVIACQ